MGNQERQCFKNKHPPVLDSETDGFEKIKQPRTVFTSSDLCEVKLCILYLLKFIQHTARTRFSIVWHQILYGARPIISLLFFQMNLKKQNKKTERSTVLIFVVGKRFKTLPYLFYIVHTDHNSFLTESSWKGPGWYQAQGRGYILSPSHHCAIFLPYKNITCYYINHSTVSILKL